MISIGSTVVCQALDQLGRLLQYPDENLPVYVRDARQQIRSMIPAADNELAFFDTFVNTHDLAYWRQVYTDAFDLDPLFKIYIGYHLFGETYKRSHFLVKLNEHYCAHEYDCRPELPDHLAVALRFLPHCDHEEFREGLILEGIVPSIKNMLGKSATTDRGEDLAAQHTTVRSLQDAIRAEQRQFYQPDEIAASWHPEAFGQGVITEGLKDVPHTDHPPFGTQSMEGHEFDRPSCGPCPLATGPLTGDLGTQLKGVPEHEKEKDMRKEEVRKGEEERLSHPYAHVLRALEQVLGGKA